MDHVVGADAAAASFLHVFDVAVYRPSMIAGDQTPTDQACKTEQAQQRHRWSLRRDGSNRCATDEQGLAYAVLALHPG